MSLMTLSTIVRRIYLGSKTTNVTCSTTATAEFASATAPVTNTASGIGSIVVGSATNYLKIHPWASAGTPIIRVIGWSFCTDTNMWIPHSIAEIQMTALNTTGMSVNGATLYGASALNRTAGDAKIFAPVSGGNTDAYFVLDAQGFERIEFQARSSTNTHQFNIHVGDM